MFETLLQSSYFALFLIIALGFMLGRIQIKGLSLYGENNALLIGYYINFFIFFRACSIDSLTDMYDTPSLRAISLIDNPSESIINLFL